MMTFGARSIRIGELRYEDLAPQVGGARNFEVLGLDARGVPLVLAVSMTEKFCRTGWHSRLACGCCGLPAGVLTISGKIAACRRCIAMQTLHHRRKNTKEWSTGGKVLDALLRAAARSGSERSAHRLARELRKVGRASVSATLAEAEVAMRGADELTLRRPL
jgi:hypothetical protein